MNIENEKKILNAGWDQIDGLLNMLCSNPAYMIEYGLACKSLETRRVNIEKKLDELGAEN